MAESAGAVLDQFQLSRAPILPELLLKGLALQDETGVLASDFAPEKLQEYLQENPLLMLQGQIRLGKLPANSLNAGSILQELGQNEFYSLLHEQVRQYSPFSLRKQQETFYYLNWRHALLCSNIAVSLSGHCEIARQVELGSLAQLVNLGELVLAVVYPDEYVKLHAKTSSELELCRLERQAYATDHAELGAALLERLGLDSFYCDALRYHHESIDAVADASKEVKLLWLANQMAGKEGIDFDLVQAGQRLFGLEQESLRNIHQAATEKLAGTLKEYALSFNGNKRLPLPEQGLASGRSSIKAQILMEARGLSRFDAALLAASGATQFSLLEVLRELAQQCFGRADAMIFRKDGQSEKITLVKSTLADPEESDLSLTLSEDPSLIAASFMSSRPAVYEAKQEDLKVADRQILAMLKAPALLCDPVVVRGEPKALFVFGVNPAAGQEYLAGRSLRSALHQLWLEHEEKAAATSLSNREFHYQQKIREAIHEANNPLSIIKNYLQLLSLNQEQDSETQEEIKVIETEIERVKQILNRLGDDSVNEDRESALDLNKIITSINKVFSASIPQDQAIKVELALAPELPYINGKANSLKQVLINLLKNAAEACGESGNIQIETRSNIMLDQTNYVLISIRDDGPGIPEPVLQKLFQPGNTSKGEGHTGSGLAIVKSFMDELGGVISCQSDERGTIFSLYLPRPAGNPNQEGKDPPRESNRENNNNSKVYDFKR